VGRIPLPKGLVRLAAVLAEIAHNDATSANTEESVCDAVDKVKPEGDNH
jgi:hypothetical protein